MERSWLTSCSATGSNRPRSDSELSERSLANCGAGNLACGRLSGRLLRARTLRRVETRRRPGLAAPRTTFRMYCLPPEKVRHGGEHRRAVGDVDRLLVRAQARNALIG